MRREEAIALSPGRCCRLRSPENRPRERPRRCKGAPYDRSYVIEHARVSMIRHDIREIPDEGHGHSR